MRRGAGHYICWFAAWMMLCVLFPLALSGCAGATRKDQRTVVCIKDDNSLYSEIISKSLPYHTVIAEEQGSRRAYSFLNAGYEVEAFDAQAISALENGIAGHWYPHYLATVVIAVDRDRTDAPIKSWSDLPAAGEITGYSDKHPDLHLLMAAIAYGLEGDGFTQKKAAALLKALPGEKRLAWQMQEPPIVICYDYQAAALIRSGRNIEIIVPDEGTLTYRKGLLSGRELSFAGDVEGLLLSAGFRLLDGRCDDTLYPGASDYGSAAAVTDYTHLNTFFQDIFRIFRRNVLHTRLYSSSDAREHQFFVLIYMILVVIWIASVVRRAMQKGVRRAALVTGIALLGWITLRLIKYQVVEAGVLNRYLWYSFYLFQLALPLLLLWLAWVIDQPGERQAPPKWLGATAALNAALAALVLTNDLHNWVFRLDLNNPNWPSEYAYGAAFFLVTAAWAVQLVIVVAMLIVKSRRTLRKRGFLFPMAFYALLLLYAVGYITRLPIAWESDYTMIVGLFTLIFIEVCMRTGMVPVNTEYARLFTHSPLNMQIVDGAGAIALSSAAAAQVDHTLLQNALASYPHPVEQDRNTLLFATAIVGGSALWQEDISSLNRLHGEIDESVRRLAAANAMLAEENKIKRELDEESAKVQLMKQLESEIAPHLNRLSAMLGEPGTAGGRPGEAARIALLLCYVKRRSNLFFREQETGALPADELAAYMDELAGMADYAGVKIVVTSEIKTATPVRQATLLYDFFYRAIDWAAKRESPRMIAHLGSEKGAATMRLLPSGDVRSFELKADLLAAIASAGGVYSTKDLDGAGGISLAFPRGGEAGG